MESVQSGGAWDRQAQGRGRLYGRVLGEGWVPATGCAGRDLRSHPPAPRAPQDDEVEDDPLLKPDQEQAKPITPQRVLDKLQDAKVRVTSSSSFSGGKWIGRGTTILVWTPHQVGHCLHAAPGSPRAPAPHSPTRRPCMPTVKQAELDVIVDVVGMVEAAQFLSVAHVPRRAAIQAMARDRALALAGKRGALRGAAARLRFAAAALRGPAAAEAEYLDQVRQLMGCWHLRRAANGETSPIKRGGCGACR